MSKYRVYQLAKEFSLDTKQVIDILNKNNFKKIRPISSQKGTG